MTDEEYQAEYDKATKALEEGKPVEPAKAAEPEIAKVEEPKAPEAKAVEPTPEVDPLKELREKVEKTEKALKDTQAWGTKNAQELANLRREQQERERAAMRPAILDANPELEAAIKYVNPQPVQKNDDHEQWKTIVNTAHPGIFDINIDPELEQALMVRLQALGEQVNDPLIAIREISKEKEAYAERMIGKRFAAESAKAAQKTAMSVPGAGAGGARTAPQDTDLEAKNRILNMSSSEFEKERRKVLGY
jgi:hypothetical protein